MVARVTPVMLRCWALEGDWLRPSFRAYVVPVPTLFSCCCLLQQPTLSPAIPVILVCSSPTRHGRCDARWKFHDLHERLFDAGHSSTCHSPATDGMGHLYPPTGRCHKADGGEPFARTRATFLLFLTGRCPGIGLTVLFIAGLVPVLKPTR